MPLFGKLKTASPPAETLSEKIHILHRQQPLIWLEEASVPEESLCQIVKECWRYNLDSNTSLIESLAAARQRVSLKSSNDTINQFFSGLDQLFFYGSLSRYPLPISHHQRLCQHSRKGRPLIALDGRSRNVNSTYSYYDHVTRTIHFHAQRGGIMRSDLLSLLVHEMVHAYVEVFATRQPGAPVSMSSTVEEIEVFIVESITIRIRRLKAKKRQKFPAITEGSVTDACSDRRLASIAAWSGTAGGDLSDEPTTWTLETLRAIETYWDSL